MSKGILDGGRPKLRGRLDLHRQTDLSHYDNLLSEEVKEKIREKARLMVQNELKDRVEKQLLDQYLTEERRALDPDEEQLAIFLHLPLHMPYIMLDGTQYFHDNTYYVVATVAAVLIEQMNRGWAHEELTEVRDSRTRRRSRAPAGMGIGNYLGERAPRGLSVSAGALQGASSHGLLGISPN